MSTPAAPPDLVLVLADDLGIGDLGAYGSDLVRTRLQPARGVGGEVRRHVHPGVDRHPGSGGPAHRSARRPLRTARVGASGRVERTAGGRTDRGPGPEVGRVRHGPFRAVAARLRRRAAPAGPGLRHLLGHPVRLRRDAAGLVRAAHRGRRRHRPRSGRTARHRGRRGLRARRAPPDALLRRRLAPRTALPLRARPPLRRHLRSRPVRRHGRDDRPLPGQLLSELRRAGRDRNTLVVVTSDNGPRYEGSTQRRRGRKPEVMDGGVRVPFIASWLHRPLALVDDTPRSLLDLTPTLCALAGAQPPADLDGEDMSALLTHGETTPRGPVVLFFDAHLNAVRSGRWKLHHRYGNDTRTYMPQLFDVSVDPREAFNLAETHPEIVADLLPDLLALRAEVAAEAAQRSTGGAA